MLEKKSLNIEIYVKLLDEGIDVFRPVIAIDIGGKYKILSDNKSPEFEDEKWEFSLGDIVDCYKKEGNLIAFTKL